MAELSWHVDAVTDVDAIGAFIARDSPTYATRFVARIVAIAEHLRRYPELGRMVPEIGEAAYREVIFQNYRIVYRLSDKNVVILGVFHGAMDLERKAEQRDWDFT